MNYVENDKSSASGGTFSKLAQKNITSLARIEDIIQNMKTNIKNSRLLLKELSTRIFPSIFINDVKTTLINLQLNVEKK